MNLSDTISKYYPLKLQAFSKEYDESEEYKELLQQVVFFQKHSDYSAEIFGEISKILLPGFEVTDNTKLQFLDRCFSFHIKKSRPTDPDNYRVLIICVSVLGPFYCIYEEYIHNINDNSGRFLGFLNDINFSINEEEFPPNFVNDLKIVAESVKLQEVTSEVFTKHCPGYTFFGISFEKFTVFNGLFKDEF